MIKTTALFSAIALIESIAAIAGPGKDSKRVSVTDVWTCPMKGGVVQDHTDKGVSFTNKSGTYTVHFCCARCPDDFAKLSPKEKTAKIAAAVKNEMETKKDRKEPSMNESLSINGVVLTAAEVQAIEKKYGVQLVAGKYWYDRNCGAWGIEGGPTVGFVMPGISVGGPLRADASGGNTNVFINGRELHYLDVLGLQQLGQVLPGRYWVDARWNCGYEGGQALFNIALLMSARSSASKGGTWSSTTKHFSNNTTVGGDGGSFMYVSGKDHHGNSYSYFP